MHTFPTRLIRLILSATFLALLGTSGVSAAEPWKDHGPLGVSPEGRHLQHQDGTPFLWLGDTAWALFYKLTREEVATYLDDRQQKGFNVIQAVAYWYPHGEDGPGPLNAPNAYGHRPFVGSTEQPSTSQPLVKEGGGPEIPNDYWDHADFVVEQIRRRGMYLALLPCWGRAYINANQEKSSVVFDEGSARAYGQFLGTRYRTQPNIIWVMGGDIDPDKGIGDRLAIYRAMAEAIGQAVTGKPLQWNRPDPGWSEIFITYHPSTESATFFHQDAWLDANGIQTWTHVDKVQQAVARCYGFSEPVKPALFLEGNYEQMRPSEQVPDPPLRVRRQAYQALLSGAAGHTYGAGSMWDFRKKSRTETSGIPWVNAMQLSAAAQTGSILRQLLEQMEWWNLVPDQNVIAEGQGEGAKTKVAACTADNSRVVVYFADATPATLKLALPAAAWTATWRRPSDGARQPGTVPDSMNLTPPADWPDALLVLEARH